MFPSFLPATVQKLTESTSINLAKQIEHQPISTPLRKQPIVTSYVHQGQGGTPILLLHGFDSSVLEFRRLLPRLAPQNETWAVDLLGFGFTERDVNVQISPRAIGTHLYGFWRSLIQQPVILVGTSMGGAAAINFTLNHPEAVQSLVLIGSAGMSAGPIFGKFIFPPFDSLAAEFLRNPKVRQGISETAYFDKTFASRDAQICAALHLEMPLWNRALISFTKSGGYGSFRKILSKIQQQTLILWGENDRILGTADAQKFKQAIVNSQLIWIKNCGHVPHLEQPQLTTQYILNFIQSN
ncbi:alpha/beta hydrolase fold family protein [Lyngbya aestuarii BL J]|uniref:Alpha/beta hydrolase fold family protein n=1 Tax=Lyngbya aestuarii BL J TaxID=1348334 RepID=U7QAF9_9CYAN|nr:alpha/beta hydrolase [Lyngbya aestuarii]ERT04000.1 alpha/beta hydrolase fold family protein [Lyngbya aestuarii BL J]